MLLINPLFIIINYNTHNLIIVLLNKNFKDHPFIYHPSSGQCLPLNPPPSLQLEYSIASICFNFS